MESPDLVPSLEAEKPSVLVVEDEFLIRYGIADELRDSGFRVVEAHSADEAWKYLSAGGRIDFIFSDVQTPGSMDGIALAQKVRGQFPGIPVLLTSGAIDPKTIDGVAPFVHKPYRAANVIAQILTTLKKRP
jgi:two-component system, response regulator PdtaR